MLLNEVISKPSSVMPLLSLPNELLLLVGKNLAKTKDVNSLLQTNRRLWYLLTSQLHARALEDKDGMLSLHWAVVNNHEPLVSLLLFLGIPVDVRENVRYNTPIHRGARHGHIDMVRLLLSNGAHVTVCNSLKQTPLHWAAVFGHLEMVRLLLEEAGGGNEYVDARDSHGGTALHWAARCGYVEVCRLLLEYGADVSMRNDFGWTARKTAEVSGYDGVAELLRLREKEIGILV